MGIKGINRSMSNTFINYENKSNKGDAVFTRTDFLIRISIYTLIVSTIPLIVFGLLIHSNGSSVGLMMMIFGLGVGSAGVIISRKTIIKYEICLLDTLKAMKENPGNNVDVNGEIFNWIKSLNWELHETKNFYHTILASLNDAILISDKTGAIKYLNAKAENILGIDQKGVLGKHYGQVISKNFMVNQKHFDLSKIGDTLNIGITYEDIELDGTLQGTRYVVSLSTSILQDTLGQIAGVLLVIKEHTEKKLLEEQVQKSEGLALAEQMAAGVVHELRNPLQSIKGFAQLLGEKEYHHKQILTYSETINAEIDRINVIIKEFLNLSKPLEATLRRVDLNRMIREVVVLMRSEATLKNSLIEDDYGANIPYIMVDEFQIKQALFNLCYHGLASMPNGGVLKIKSWCDYHLNEVRVQIWDMGVGMDDKTLSQLNNPLFSSNIQGTGLSLSLSYRIIQNHGGRIEVESVLGKGSNFTVILPGLAGLAENSEGYREKQ